MRKGGSPTSGSNNSRLTKNNPYTNKPFPPKLGAAIDANDASIEAIGSLTANQETEVAGINNKYDDFLVRLRVPWVRSVKRGGGTTVVIDRVAWPCAAGGTAHAL
jgi:hypothetical protein